MQGTTALAPSLLPIRFFRLWCSYIYTHSIVIQVDVLVYSFIRMNGFKIHLLGFHVHCACTVRAPAFFGINVCSKFDCEYIDSNETNDSTPTFKWLKNIKRQIPKVA